MMKQQPSGVKKGQNDKRFQSKNSSSIISCQFNMKNIALLLLVFQTVAVVLTLRYSKIKLNQAGAVNGDEAQDAKEYLNTSVVVSSEALKFVCCLVLVFFENKCCFADSANILIRDIIQNPKESLHVGVPAILYVVQNNLIFVSLTNLSAAVYQTTYQLKILTTALLSVLILRRNLAISKWAALVLLTLGVALIQIPSGGTAEEISPGGNVVIGLTAVACACFTSGFAGVYLEKMLKTSSKRKTSIWVRNIQLSIYGCIFGLVGAYINDGEKILSDGFLQNYTYSTYIVVFLQALGGLAVAAVLKYADNILKCFANAVSIILSCCLSYYLLDDFNPTVYFALGTTTVILATYIYGVDIDQSSYAGMVFKLIKNSKLSGTKSQGSEGKIQDMSGSFSRCTINSDYEKIRTIDQVELKQVNII